MTAIPEPVFDHLLRMTDRRGTFEHARLAVPDPEHGYCTDDMARVLVVATREPGLERTLNGVARIALQFLSGAQALTGACRNRMDSKGNWVDEPAVEDAWGRSLWGLGTAAARSDVVWARQSAIMQFERGAQERSPWPRAMAFAALGAAEMLAFDPEHRAARLLIIDYAASVAESNGDPVMAMARASTHLRERGPSRGDDRRGRRARGPVPAAARSGSVGVASRQSKRADGHLSVTPVEGRGPGDNGPAFDQQPIEVSSLADACARAAAVDSNPMWPDGVRAAAAWFQGANDAVTGDVGPRHGWRIRRPARRRSEPKPGRRVDAGCALNAAACAATFCSAAMTSVRVRACHRSPQRLAADPSRVISRLFVPGQEGFEHQDSRAGAVLRRILALDEDQVRTSLDDVVTRFDRRHRDLIGTFRRHARELADRLDATPELSDARMMLLGATFTSEYAIEGAALCNPSMVAHPNQTGTPPGGLRFVMSVRGIGEGHTSSIGFRTGVIDAAGGVTIDAVGPYATVGDVVPALLDAAVLRSELSRLHDAGEGADYVLDSLGERFTRNDLEEQLDRLQKHRRTRGHAPETISLIRTIADRTYGVEFAEDIPLSERILWPAMGAEAAGMEDARFVRFVDDDGSVTFYASYTAYSGTHISQQLLETSGLQVVHLHADGRQRRREQGFGAVSPSGRRSFRRHVEIGPRIEFVCVLGCSVCVDGVRALSAADPGVGGVAARKLWAAHRNRGWMAGAHPWRRSDADVPDRRDIARSGESVTDGRAAPRAAAESGC